MKSVLLELECGHHRSWPWLQPPPVGSAVHCYFCALHNRTQLELKTIVSVK